MTLGALYQNIKMLHMEGVHLRLEMTLLMWLVENETDLPCKLLYSMCY